MELNRIHTYLFYKLWNSLEHRNDMACKATCMQHFWKVPREGLLPHWQDKTNTLHHNGQDSIWNLHYCRAGLLLRQRVRLLKLGQAMCMQPFGEEQDKIYWISHNIFTVYYTYYTLWYVYQIQSIPQDGNHVICIECWCTILKFTTDVFVCCILNMMDAASLCKFGALSDQNPEVDVSLLPWFSIGFQPHHVQAQSTKVQYLDVFSQGCFHIDMGINVPEFLDAFLDSYPSLRSPLAARAIRARSLSSTWGAMFSTFGATRRGSGDKAASWKWLKDANFILQ